MILQIFQFILLILSFIIGIFISILIGKTKSNFGGSCLLYANINKDGDKIKEGEHDLKHLLPGSHASCNFCVIVGAISVVTSLLLLIGLIFFALKRRYDMKRSTSRRVRLSNYDVRAERPTLIGGWINFIVCVVLTVLLFIASCLISSGFNSFCEDAIEKIFVDLKKCKQLEQYVGKFYSHLGLVQVSSWVGSAAWLLLAILARIQLRRLNLDHKRFRKSPAVLNQDYELINRSPVL